VFCEGRATAQDAGTCSYQAACLGFEHGGFHDFQDCDSDPRNGCEDTNRWCTVGLARTQNPRGTQSDLCSKAWNYFRDAIGFDIRNQFRDAGRSTNLPSFDCYTLDTLFHVNRTALFPYCDRDVTHLATRGDCVFVCEAGYADCNGDSRDGCEASISFLTTCDEECVDCEMLPGINRGATCIADVATGPGQYRCQFTCPGGSGTSNCADIDGKWQNGCERALNGDFDRAGLFVNLGAYMDCSVMNSEAKVNPELFRHHLHIDLTVPVPTSIRTLPAGTIFCNHDLVPAAPFGYCHFICIPGFVNTDRFSYNGCEAAIPGGPALGYNATIIASPAPVVVPLTFGGYWMGDYEVEFYMAFLRVRGPGLPLTLPINYQYFGTQSSLLYPVVPPAFPPPILWY